MSFSAQVKRELCKNAPDKPCCALAELYGALLFGQQFTFSCIRVVSENQAVVHRLSVLMKAAFGFGFDMKITPEARGGKTVLTIGNRGKIETMMEAFGQSRENSLAVHLNFAVIEEDCCKASLLRGAFLSGGSITDPEKDYHLELVTPHLSLGNELSALMTEVGLPPRMTMRKSNRVVYLKVSELIEDFLIMTGAPAASIKLMGAKVEKDFRNNINRKVNCETANLTKTVEASGEQSEAIEKLARSGVLGTLPGPLRETARLRLQHPEATLNELSALHSPAIGRSGLNHRLRKLVAISRMNGEEKA